MMTTTYSIKTVLCTDVGVACSPRASLLALGEKVLGDRLSTTLLAHWVNRI